MWETTSLLRLVYWPRYRTLQGAGVRNSHSQNSVLGSSTTHDTGFLCVTLRTIQNPQPVNMKRIRDCRGSALSGTAIAHFFPTRVKIVAEEAKEPQGVSNCNQAVFAESAVAHRCTAGGTACRRPAQEQAGQNLSMD